MSPSRRNYIDLLALSAHWGRCFCLCNMPWSFLGGYSPLLSLGYKIKKNLSVGTEFNLQPNARQEYMSVVFVCAAGRREQRIPKWYLSCLAIKLLHLIGTHLPCSLWNALGSFCFFLAYDLSKGLAAVCWVMLRFRTGTQCTLQVPSFCSCGCGEDRGHPYAKCADGEVVFFWRVKSH